MLNDQYGAITAGSVRFSWSDGITDYTARADLAGTISGDATGTVVNNTGEFDLWPNRLPPVGTAIRCQWIRAGAKSDADVAALGVVIAKATLSGTLPDAPLVPGQLELCLQVQPTADLDVLNQPTLTLTDDGEGRLQVVDGNRVLETVGAVDYTTGQFSVTVTNTAFAVKQYGYKPVPADFGTVPAWTWIATRYEVHPCQPTAITRCRYLATTHPENDDQSFSLTELAFPLTTNSELIAEGSLHFTFGGKAYLDRGGFLYTDVDPATGAGTKAGAIDYVNGLVRITNWLPGQPNAAPQIQSLLTYLDAHTVSDIAFRTPGAPLRPGSLYIQCRDSAGAMHELTVPTTGVIDTGIFHGTLSHENGICQLTFGRKVTATDYVTAAWYDPALVDANGKILMPVQVFADSIRYNCVTYSYLPLDKDIIKLDPVRLPTDGRVPILKKGDIVVVHHTASTQVEQPVPSSQLALGRRRLASVWVEDAAGQRMPDATFTADLDWGSLTWSATLDWSGYTLPLTVYHRIEDMAMATDVEISGRVTLSKPLSHDYPKTDTFVSSALIIDDLWARVASVFDQQTWTGVWSDSLIGNALAAEFNHADFPITVTNAGSITERWALIFSTAQTFKIVGEHLGQIGEGSINEACAPMGPHSHTSYFRVPAAGWGSGWAAGNVLRFNTYGANAPFWMARTILQSESAIEYDQFALQLRGNVNKD